MKFPQCIVLLLLTVASHQVLAHGGGRCGEDKYLHGGICCNLCPAGTHFVADCTLSTDTVCKPCDDGITYTAHPNRLEGCIRCGHCDDHVGLVVKPDGACVPTNDTECQCREGMYLPQESSEVCTHHSLCPRGEQVAKEGTTFSDTVCQPCPYGTFSNRESLSKCRLWRNCTAMGMKTVRNGTSTRNARCEEFATTSTEKPPSSSTQTSAPKKVNSTTVNMRTTISSSASTATTVTYTSTALRMTAAPTSTRHSSTAVTKPPVQQMSTIPDNILPTTKSTMSGTAPPSDNNPEVNGGDGPNNHGIKAQVATAVVVGVIALVLIVLCLLGIAYYCRKLQRRQRWQRRCRCRSFPLPEDEDLQERDLERQLQLPRGIVDRVGHARRTSTGATPGDTSPLERESLIQSQEGTLPHTGPGCAECPLPAIPITDEHLAKLPEVMPTNWKKIGMAHFQIRTQDLDKVTTKHPYDRDMQIVEMFKLWIRKNGKVANLCNLCQKLIDAGIECTVLHEMFSKGETQPKG